MNVHDKINIRTYYPFMKSRLLIPYHSIKINVDIPLTFFHTPKKYIFISKF